MLWLKLGIIVAGGLVLSVFLALWVARWLGKKEPYAGFMGLPIRGKLAFFRLLLKDRRVPLYLKVLALVVIAYVVSPIDLMPGIALDDIALTILALALIIKLTPRPVVLDLVQKAQSGGTTTDPAPPVPEKPPPSDCRGAAQQ